jgi:hypothetical protein
MPTVHHKITDFRAEFHGRSRFDRCKFDSQGCDRAAWPPGPYRSRRHRSLSIVRPSLDSALFLPFAAVALVAAAKQSAFVKTAQKDDPSTPLPDAIGKTVSSVRLPNA